MWVAASTGPEGRAVRARLAITGGLLAALAATNRWMGWSQGAALVSAHDEATYRRIALAAPSLPSFHISNQYAQVFVLNYLAGLVHSGLGIGVDTVFRVASLGLILGICAVLAGAVGRSGIGTPLFTVCMALLVLNTYSLRYYLIAVGYLTDLTFVLSIAVLALALVRERFWLALGAIALATLARQSALPAAVGLAVILALLAPWRSAPVGVRLTRTAAALVVPFAVFGILLAVSASFSFNGTPGIAGLTVLGDVERLPSGLGSLAVHVVRTLSPLLGLGAVLAVALTLRARSRPGAPLGPEAKACLVLGAAVWLQALGLNYSYSGHPERLAVLSLTPFVVALAYVLRDLEADGMSLGARWSAAIVLILLAGSLHYLYTWLGPATATQGGVLQLAAALAAGAVLWRGLARGQGPPAKPAGIVRAGNQSVAAANPAATASQFTTFHHASM